MIGQHFLLSAAEELELARRVMTENFDVHQQMIEANLCLIHCPRGIELLDLIAEGNLDLVHALEKLGLFFALSVGRNQLRS